MMLRFAFLCSFPASGFVVDMTTGLPVTYARRPTSRQRKRCDPYSIASVVRVRVHPAGSRTGDNDLPTYEVLP